jgi:hypothetical protein
VALGLDTLRSRRVILAAGKKPGVDDVISQCVVRPPRFGGDDRKGFRPGRIQGLHHPRRAVQELRQLPDGGDHRAGVRRRSQEHRFIRADAYGSYEDAVTFTLSKARQIIDLQGVRIFD